MAQEALHRCQVLAGFEDVLGGSSARPASLATTCTPRHDFLCAGGSDRRLTGRQEGRSGLILSRTPAPSLAARVAPPPQWIRIPRAADRAAAAMTRPIVGANRSIQRT
jgi:hypothetical protein